MIHPSCLHARTIQQAYALPKATAFSDVSADDDVVELLYAAYGGEIENLDACVGALAEGKEASLGGIFGLLLHTAWVDQLYRTFFGDRYHHLHSRPIENVSLANISGLINQTLGVTDLPASGFTVPEVTVCTGECEAAGISGVSLAERYAMSWEVRDVVEGMLVPAVRYSLLRGAFGCTQFGLFLG